MCDVFDLNKALVGVSGKYYYCLASLKQAEDCFGRELLLEHNTWAEDISDDVPMTFEDQIDEDFCLCYLQTEALLEKGGLRKGIDFKLDYQDWNSVIDLNQTEIIEIEDDSDDIQ